MRNANEKASNAVVAGNSNLIIKADLSATDREIFSPAALSFVEALVSEFGAEADALLAARHKRQQELQSGKKLHFLKETQSIRNSEWKVAPIPKDLQDRRVEITGPVERKMMINALNSGAKAFMADLEDSLSPGWRQIVEGQVNLRDAVNRTITYKSPEGKEYKLNDTIAVLIVRPRGWHLKERHVEYQGKAIHGAFLDFGLYFFHNAKALLARGSGPYFYLPKLESHLEARLWSKIFNQAEKTLGIAHGSIKATVLIETIPAAFEMEEILFELKDYIVAENAGRWDYIFSYIKKHSHDPAFVCPDRGQITMTKPFLRAYAELLVKTCHKRGAMAMGGMSAYIPVKGNEEANAKAFANVKADKEREAGIGHDGTWVAHPGLIPVAMEVFNRLMPTPNQISRERNDVVASEAALLEVPEGTITEAGVRNNISVSLQYLASWLGGNGCVPIFNLMEDAATAEISRTQLWQWVHHKATLDTGADITEKLIATWLDEELANIKASQGAQFAEKHFNTAKRLLLETVKKPELDEFVTLVAYSSLE